MEFKQLWEQFVVTLDVFEVRPDVRWGLTSSPLLFVVFMETVSGEFGVALPWGLLCAGGLVVMAETEDGLIERLDGWKDGMESGGMRADMGEAKVVISGEPRGLVQMDAGWPCGVCGGSVGGGSMQCAGCHSRVHEGVVV